MAMSDAQTIESSLLRALAVQDVVTSDTLASQLSVDHQEIVGASKSLEADGYVLSNMVTKRVWKLTKEALNIIESGSPEYLLWELLNAKPVSKSDVETALGADVAGVAITNGMKAKIFQINMVENVVVLQRAPNVTTFNDAVRSSLKDVRSGMEVDRATADVLKKRKLAMLDNVKVFEYTKGPQFAPERGAKAVGDLTRQMLQDGSWKTMAFKEYNFNATGAEVEGGQLHPLLKVRQEFREIFMELGFQEMNTQHWAESSFWNFDSLFIPQQHPARDVQDTFFLSKPATSTLEDRDLLEKVHKSHNTFFHSTWKEEEAARNVLRTHTTGTSAYVLYQLAKMSTPNPDGTLNIKPGRYYSIDRVFRNEEMDRTHLCEFHQVEGCVVDRDISLAKMMHTFDAFFRRIGVVKLRFKPAFNPYTEPSMEIFGYHSGLKKWMEVGNSGLFRPELLAPLGLDEGVSVMAWGLSLERPTMIKYGISSIHELFGHRVDIKFIKHSAIARF